MSQKIKQQKEYVYWYKGPVYVFDKMVCDNWSGMTVAPSEKKARSNLCYQYRQQVNLNKSIPVNLVYDIHRKD